MRISIPDLRVNSLGLSDLRNSLTGDSNINAEDAITDLDEAIETKLQARTNLGAYENRLKNALLTVQNMHLNLSSARSRIIDTDYAQTASNFTRRQILVESSQAMLAQANLLPQMILQLLG